MCKSSGKKLKIYSIKIFKDLHPGNTNVEKTPPVTNKKRNGSRNSKKKAA
jgi:hypothetical protein